MLMTSINTNAQTYRYLSFRVLGCENYKIQEINWYADGIDYPNPHLNSLIPANNANGETVLGADPSWARLSVYDGVIDESSHFYYGNITDPQLQKNIILDLGDGNAILPDSIELINPAYSIITQFEVWASNDNSNWSLLLDTIVDPIPWSNVDFVTHAYPLSIKSDIIAPTSPSSLTASHITGTSTKLKWGLSTDNVEVLEYEVFQDDVSIGTTKSTNFYVANLIPGMVYNFYINAKDFSDNISDNSDEIEIITNPMDTSEPSTPSNLKLDYQNATTIGFSWDQSADNIAVTGYIVYLDGVALGATSNNKYAIPGLESESTYAVSIKSKDAAGNFSEFSEELAVSIGNIEQKMTIGTNFWDVEWGGDSADPFKTSHKLVTEENPWRTELLNEVGIYSGFRFMDWGQVNNSNVSHWLDRNMKTDINQKEVAFEWLIDFSNKMNRDIWICVPHKVIDRNGFEKENNHYVRKLAILIKTGVDMQDIDLEDAAFENLSEMTRNDFITLGGVATCEPLKSNLKIYIEYSNETWNWSFAQATYALIEGHALNLDPEFTGPANEDWKSYSRFHAWAAIRVFEQMDEVFGSNNPKIIKMDAYQGVSPTYQIFQHLEIYNNPLHNPKNIYPTAFSPAPYFGSAVNGVGTHEEIIASINEGIDMRVDNTRETREYLNTLESELGRNFKLISYEGGQHITTNAIGINRDPAMYGLYTRYLDSLSLYLDEFWHYTHSGKFGDGGAWGAKEYIGDDIAIAHKYRALVDYINNTEIVDVDTIPPTVPQNLTDVSASNNSLTFSWDNSTDNVGVDGYKVYMNGFYVDFVNNPNYKIAGLSPNTNFNISVRATDFAGNTSDYSQIIQLSTTSVSTYALTFNVTDGINPLSEATITFKSNTFDTDNDGQVVIGNLIPEEGLDYTVTKSGFVDFSGTISIVDTDLVEDVVLVIISGTEDIDDKDITLFPNPVSDYLFVETKTKIKTVKLNSLSGNTIFSQQVMGYSYSLDTKALNSGVYILEIVNENNVRSVKRIVKK